MEQNKHHDSYLEVIWKQFKKQRIARIALTIICLFILVGIYAPFLASNKPLMLKYRNEWYFPLFRYLLYSGFYTKKLDIFFNLFIFTLPLSIILSVIPKKIRLSSFLFILLIHTVFFIYHTFRIAEDPASDISLNHARQEKIQQMLLQEKTQSHMKQLPSSHISWDFDLQFLSPYARLNNLLQHQQNYAQHKRLEKYAPTYFEKNHKKIPSLWQVKHKHEEERIEWNKKYIKENENTYHIAKEKFLSLTNKEENPSKDSLKEIQKLRQTLLDYETAKANLLYIQDKRNWLEQEEKAIHFQLMPLIRPFHWEDDAGGDQNLNQYISFWELTRINRKDLIAALLFGIRISLLVGLSSVLLSLAIGIPIGAIAGYYGGKIDIFVFRLLEIWESMPSLFMLLLVVAILQTKSIFLIITVLGLFGWTNFCRFVRGETLKQRNLPYVDACKALGFSNRYIIFSHILPNAIPPILTLLPFSIMGAITSEASLSFLGLGEEGSCSWGILMDEGRHAFPGESYLLWPPGILLTIFLINIALVGDSLRDAFDPRMHR